MATPLCEKFDPKKRALEALERRFAFSKDETDLHDRTGKRRTSGGDTAAAAELPSDVKAPASKIGHFVFSGSSLRKLSQKASGRDPAYSELSDTFHKNLINPGGTLSWDGATGVHRVVHDLLQNGESARKYMQGSRSMKIDNWFLLDNFVPNDFSSAATARIKSLQNHSKRSKRYLSMKQHQKLGSLIPNFHKHELFKPMHELWKDYITNVLKETGKNQMPRHLLTADLHGAILLVVQCKQSAFVGTFGIMIRETAETFGIITESDKFRVVPKKGSVFIFQVGSFKITLIGDRLTQRDSGI